MTQLTLAIDRNSGGPTTPTSRSGWWSRASRASCSIRIPWSRRGCCCRANRLRQRPCSPKVQSTATDARGVIGGVNPPPRLRLEPAKSRCARLGIGVGALATAVLIVSLPLPWGWRAVLLVAIVLLASRALHRQCGRGLPALIHLGVDGRVTVTGQDGRSRNGSVCMASFVHHRFTTLVWAAEAPNGCWRWRRSEAILFLPDMLPADAFRQLRVRLRHGHGRSPPVP